MSPPPGHVLRLLATFHWLREVTPDVFANNRLSSYIDSGKSFEQLKNACVTLFSLLTVICQRSLQSRLEVRRDRWCRRIHRDRVSLTSSEPYRSSILTSSYSEHSGDEAFRIMTNLADWLLNDQGTKTASPFSKTFETNLEYYTWLEEPGNEHRLVRFGHAMHGTQQFEIAENIITGT